jgi:hypothetical protein
MIADDVHLPSSTPIDDDDIVIVSAGDFSLAAVIDVYDSVRIVDEQVRQQ